MPDVFLSYSREDQATARRFASGLERAGFSVWWDQALSAGQAFDRVTEKALEEARAVVVLWSKRSVDSNWVRAEATQAHARQRLVPVMIEPCKRPILFELTHAADLAGWNGDAAEPRWRSFIADLRASVDAGQSAPDLRAAPADAPPDLASPGRRTLWIAATAALLALAAGSGWYLLDRPGGTRAPASTQASIAVLPFVNMSGDPEQEYFSDGLTEELINQLAHIEALRVTARTSAFAFKGRAQDIRAVGEALDVAHVLEGSVRRSGDTLRVTVQLIKAADGYHLWSETFDRPVDDVFAIQDAIATAVAAKVGPSLGVAPRSADYGGTSNLEAYDHLLRGNAAYAKGWVGTRAAIEEYRRALEIDPGYSRASAELAIALAFLGGLQPGAASQQEREETTRRAIEGAPDAPLSLAAAMWLHADRREWLEAHEAGGRILASSDPRAGTILAGFLSSTGRIREALPLREAAKRADPLAMNVADVLVRQYALLDMDTEMWREYARVDGLSGSHVGSDKAVLVHLLHKGAPTGEIAAQVARTCPGADEPCAIWEQLLRSPAQAGTMLRKQLEESGGSDLATVSDIALWAAYFGDQELALDAIEVLARAASASILQTLWLPLLGEVRRQPRFKQIVSELGLVELWRKTGQWADACRPVGTDFECH